jgi:uncharacterized protein (TIGR00730 family)
MRPYEIGDPEIDARIRRLAAEAVSGPGVEPPNTDLVIEMMVTALKLSRDDADRGDLKILNSALKELRYSFLIFKRYRQIHKVTIFGSARTPPDDVNYRMAAEFARVMSDVQGWMVITGAGPGIMEAGNLGAGATDSFGVNIRLPFEAEANPYVHESRLINYKYFFSRKLMFVKESHAFALFPGGFGTLDETFELLTLIQTGKSDLHPIVLIEAPGGGYWDAWRRFVEEEVLGREMIFPADLDLFHQTHSIEDAVREICDFYLNYHSQRFVGEHLVLRLLHAPTDEDMARLNDEYGDILSAGRIEAVGAADVEIADGDHPDLPRLRLTFNRRSLGRLRQMIDDLNSLAPREEG